MKITEVRKITKKILNLISEFSMLDSLIKSMDKCKLKGLEINEVYYANAKKRRDNILNEFDKFLIPDNLKERIWDAFVVSHYQDEQWKDKDTADLIFKKVIGESPMEHTIPKVNIKTKEHDKE